MDTAYQVPALSWPEVDQHAIDTLRVLSPDCLLEPQSVPSQWIFEEGLTEKFGINYGVENLPFGTEAQFDPVTNTIILDARVYADLCDNVPRSYFTLAHEIGHAVLHRGHFKDIHTGSRLVKKFNRGSLPAYLDSEAQANRFAAEFLMPTPMVSMIVSQGVTIVDLMNIFKVNYTPAQIKYNEVCKKLGL